MSSVGLQEELSSHAFPVSAPPLEFSASQAEIESERLPLTNLQVGNRREIWFALTDVAIALTLAFASCILASILASPQSQSFTVKFAKAFSYFFNRGQISYLLCYSLVLVLYAKRVGFYRTQPMSSVLDECALVLKSVIYAQLFLLSLLFITERGDFSKGALATTAILNLFALGYSRYLRSSSAERNFAAGYGMHNVLIIGAGTVGQFIAAHLRQNPRLGYAFRGYLDAKSAPDVLGGFDELEQVIRSNFIDEVLITVPSARALVKKLTLRAPDLQLNVKVVPDLFGGIGLNAPLGHLGGIPVMCLHRTEQHALQMFVKRFFDIFVAALALVLLLPILLLIAIAIKFDSNGPIFYYATRVGHKGLPFRLVKFRTMVNGADKLQTELKHLNERSSILFKIAKDPRITRVGAWLRKYSLDELPQLINVLQGEMSLVGPRPPAVNEYEQYRLEHLRRLQVKPGMTGLWQVSARQDPSFDQYMRFDVEYIENWSLWLDLKILLLTIPAVLSGTGV